MLLITKEAYKNGPPGFQSNAAWKRPRDIRVKLWDIPHNGQYSWGIDRKEMAPESMPSGVKKNEGIITSKEAQIDIIHKMRTSLRYAVKNLIISYEMVAIKTDCHI